MKKEEITIIGLRLLAIYVLLHGVDYLISMFIMLSAYDPATLNMSVARFPMFAGVVIYIAIASGLFFAAPWLTGLMLHGPRSREEIDLREPASGTQIFILQCLGIYLLVAFGPELIDIIQNQLIAYGLTAGTNRLSAFGQIFSTWHEWLPSLFRILLSLLLIFGPRRIHELLKKAQPMREQANEPA